MKQFTMNQAHFVLVCNCQRTFWGDMCQILIGILGYILLLNIPESRHHTFTSHLQCQSQHEIGRICRLSWRNQPE
jgi:hypothetical protein